MNFNEYRKRIDARRTEIKYIQDLLKKEGYCVICGYNKDPRIIEDHHIAGRKHRDITIPVCPTCHRILSENQNAWTHRWMDANCPDRVRFAFMLRGFSDVSKLQSLILREYSDKILLEEST